MQGLEFVEGTSDEVGFPKTVRKGRRAVWVVLRTFLLDMKRAKKFQGSTKNLDRSSAALVGT
jgi:hypothetical protein